MQRTIFDISSASAISAPVASAEGEQAAQSSLVKLRAKSAISNQGSYMQLAPMGMGTDPGTLHTRVFPLGGLCNRAGHSAQQDWAALVNFTGRFGHGAQVLLSRASRRGR